MKLAGGHIRSSWDNPWPPALYDSPEMHPTPSHPVPSHTNLSEAAHPHPKIPKIPPRPDPLKQDYDSMSMNSQKPYSSINTIILTNL